MTKIRKQISGPWSFVDMQFSSYLIRLWAGKCSSVTPSAGRQITIYSIHMPWEHIFFKTGFRWILARTWTGGTKKTVSAGELEQDVTEQEDVDKCSCTHTCNKTLRGCHATCISAYNGCPPPLPFYTHSVRWKVLRRRHTIPPFKVQLSDGLGFSWNLHWNRDHIAISYW